MLTELEHRVIEGVPNDVPRTPADDHAMKFGGKDIAEGAGVNGQLAFGAECPVDAMRANALGFHDVFGNVWEVRRSPSHEAHACVLKPMHMYCTLVARLGLVCASLRSSLNSSRSPKLCCFI